MRCRVGQKKIRRLRIQTKLPIVTAMVRGNTDHAIDLFLSDGSITVLYKDWSTAKTTWKWDTKGWESEIEALGKKE